MNTISLTLNNQEITDLLKKFKFDKKLNNNHVEYTLELDHHKIHIYHTNVILIQGKNAQDIYYKLFKKKYYEVDKISNKYIDYDLTLNNNYELEQLYTNSMGSDEVGNGDFFLGISVCATYIKKDQIEWLKKIGINDSKKISDDQILKLGEQLINNITYYSLNLDAQDYNKLYEKIPNLNAIKAYLHDKCFFNLKKKVEKPYFIVIDQFVNQEKYYEYLTNLKIKPTKIDCFSTKAESKYYAVACASIIARYFHLKNKDNLCKKYGLKIPLGSSNEIIKDVSIQFIKRFSIDEFSKIVKKNFKTYNEILKLLDQN